MAISIGRIMTGTLGRLGRTERDGLIRRTRVPRVDAEAKARRSGEPAAVLASEPLKGRADDVPAPDIGKPERLPVDAAHNIIVAVHAAAPRFTLTVKLGQQRCGEFNRGVVGVEGFGAKVAAAARSRLESSAFPAAASRRRPLGRITFAKAADRTIGQQLVQPGRWAVRRGRRLGAGWESEWSCSKFFAAAGVWIRFLHRFAQGDEPPARLVFDCAEWHGR